MWPLDFFQSTRYVFWAVKKLAEVEEAKDLMTEAMDWSVFTWLFQKSKVRDVADQANEALDKLSRATKARWSEEIKTAYKALSAKSRSKGDAIDAEIQAFVKKVKEADDAAREARKDAEDTFAEAERQMNTGLAKEGCRKAIHQWELDAKAIRCAEAVPAAAKREK